MKLLFWACIVSVAFARKRRFPFFKGYNGYYDHTLRPSRNAPHGLRGTQPPPQSLPVNAMPLYPGNADVHTGVLPDPWMLHASGAAQSYSIMGSPSTAAPSSAQPLLGVFSCALCPNIYAALTAPIAPPASASPAAAPPVAASPAAAQRVAASSAEDTLVAASPAAAPPVAASPAEDTPVATEPASATPFAAEPAAATPFASAPAAATSVAAEPVLQPSLLNLNL
uniref:Uncharacterized protein n=1 Tax=Otolemur garnettii TaxID=30611 RepID=H0Y1X7_OTOGA